MGQTEICEYLDKHKNEWFTSKQLAKELKVSKSTIAMSLKRLRKTDYIYFKDGVCKTNKKHTFYYCSINSTSNGSEEE